MAGVDQNDLHEKSCFFGFSKCLHLVTFLVKKIFAFRYLFTISVVIVQEDAATRFRVAERQCRHPPLAWRQEDSRIFFTSPERSVSRVPYLAPLKKIQGRSFFAFYSSLFSQNIFTGLRHKAAQNSLFPLNFFPKGRFYFRYATDTDRLRKRER